MWMCADVSVCVNGYVCVLVSACMPCAFATVCVCVSAATEVTPVDTLVPCDSCLTQELPKLERSHVISSPFVSTVCLRGCHGNTSSYDTQIVICVRAFYCSARQLSVQAPVMENPS